MNNARRINHLIRIALFTATAIFVGLLFPRQLTIDSQVKPGQIWKTADLIAPFDFAIHKSSEELQAEQQTVKDQSPPCYRKDPGIASQQLASFESAFRLQLTAIAQSTSFTDVLRQPDQYLQYGKSLLKTIYEQGIIQLEPNHLDKGNAFVINLLEKNAAQQATIDEYYSLTDAQLMLIDSLPESKLAEPDFLLPLLENQLVPNIRYDSSTSATFLKDALANISAYRGMVKKGDLIVAKQELITTETMLKIESLKRQFSLKTKHTFTAWGTGIGYLLIVSLLMIIFFFYLKTRDPHILNHLPSLTFILLTLAIFSWLVHWAEKTNPTNAYFIPFGIAPILLQAFFNKRFALFFHIIILTIASFISSLGWNFIFLQLLCGIVILLTNVNIENWSRFFTAIVFMLACGIAALLGLTLIDTGGIMGLDTTILAWIFISAFLTMLALPMVPLLERIFGFTTAIKLRELMDLNRPLLQELALKAPGTFQHSIQVGHLSEAAALAIGANALLVRVAALYHDIGKIKNPTYFVENQTEHTSPHQDKSYTESARIIISHVHEGLSLAKKYKLPDIISDFIATHHGTTRVEYFYRKMLNERVTDDAPSDVQFRYPGPKPQTKEQTIMLLADSIEAACRSMRQPGEPEINALIEEIVQHKIDMGQLANSELSFSELEQCKSAFKKNMRSVHHQRIAYPPAAG